VQYPIITLVF